MPWSAVLAASTVSSGWICRCVECTLAADDPGRIKCDINQLDAFTERHHWPSYTSTPSVEETFSRWTRVPNRISSVLGCQSIALYSDSLYCFVMYFMQCCAASVAVQWIAMGWMVFTAQGYAKRGICRRRVTVCLSVCVCVCVSVCHTPVLYQNG